VLEADRVLLAHADHWFVREVVHFIKRTLKRLDLTARTFFAIIEPGSAFAGTLFELALAADRSYMLDDTDQTNAISLSGMNAGPLPMSNGLTRLQTRFYGAPDRVQAALDHTGPFDPQEALAAGLVTFAPDEIDWDDEVRLAVGEPGGSVARRVDRHGSEPAVCRSRDDGDEDLRPADGLAELDLPASECGGPQGRATSYGTSERAEFDFGRT
jgi:benzoyl-CoA-dihydrodiol lyase